MDTFNSNLASEILKLRKQNTLAKKEMADNEELIDWLVCEIDNLRFGSQTAEMTIRANDKVIHKLESAMAKRIVDMCHEQAH